ncbi:MAG: YcxB family protein [Clostridia bacterium]|jgi:hypothetical protein|nr:YcxB family protein [Clostridia bacterium]
MENNSNKIFINKTTNTEEAYMDFLSFHSKTFNLIYLSYTVFWAFLFLLCIILAFGSGLRLQGVTFTILLITFILYRIIRPKLVTNKELKSDKISNQSTNTYTFYEKYFEIKNKNGLFSYKYFMIKKVYETQNYFYLYVSNENAFLVSKKDFTKGSSKDFSNFMKQKKGLRYKIKV